MMRRALNENSQKTHLVSVVSSYDEALTQPLEVEESTAPAAQGAFDALPSRYKMLLAANLAFVICNMDKVNMSVAIIPMALEFGWSPSVAGTIQASFFYGKGARTETKLTGQSFIENAQLLVTLKPHS